MGELKRPEPKSYHDILEQYGDDPADIPQYLIDLENTFASPWHESENIYYEAKPYNDIRAYFTVPENSEFIGDWDLIEDRLYKIRHGLNIAGVARPLSLFAPPLDVRSIIRAAAAGNLSLAAQVQPPIPYYRSDVLIGKAVSFTQALSSLGAELLSALEKGDAEGMALLRNTQERRILDLTTQIKEKQITQVEEAGNALQASLKAAKYRVDFYEKLIKEGDASDAGETSNAAATPPPVIAAAATAMPAVTSRAGWATWTTRNTSTKSPAASKSPHRSDMPFRNSAHPSR